MPELRVTIDFRVDGDPISVNPIQRTVNVTQEALAQFTQAADNNTSSYHQIEGAVSGVLQALLFTADQAFNLTFNNAGALSMSASGLVLILGANLTAGAATNAQVNVPGTSPASVISLAGGT